MGGQDNKVSEGGDLNGEEDGDEHDGVAGGHGGSG